MNELRLKYPVRMMRRIMNVSASGYYAWVDRPLSKRAQEEVRLELEIMAAHQRNRQTYGPERLQRDLAEHGVRVGVCRIKRIRQKLGIRCKQKRRFKTTTNSAHRLPVADNLLGQQFKVSQPNAVWVSDITYIPTDERLSHRLVGELSNTVWEGCASTEVGRSSCTGGLSAPREVVYSLSSMAPWAWAKALGRCAIA